MNAAEQLWAVYRQWKHLTHQEGSAIQHFDWPLLQATQDQKRALQADIIHLTERSHAEFRSAPDHDSFDAELRRIVNELILLETENNGAIQTCLAAAQHEKAALETTSNRLRQVHNRYVPAPSPVWQNVT